MGLEERVLKALEDVHDCAAFVIDAAEGRELSDYRGDRFFRQAIGRNLENIGEGVWRMARLDPETASRISEHRRMIAFRNRITCGYDLLDDELVWETVNNEVPVLLLEVEGLLRKRGA
ncbi:MAG TPA: HepT-like ribonuclease domain-containing protein [Rubrobacter sp.]|nr:HepT-like ribonuclease domain-containing protein [Rubrobacter sp.]